MTSRNYLLLTPGPLTTSRTVKEAMLFDSCTWDDDYNLGVVQTIRQQLVQLATPADGYTAVLLQGSGSYAVEAVLGSVIGEQGKVLIVSNGAYGARMIEMAQLMGIACHPYDCGEVSRPDAAAIEQILQNDPAITHIAMVHSETTTGMLNPIDFEQYQTLISEIESEGLEEVQKKGFFDTVESNAKKLIGNFLGCFADYTVEFI
jgi:2-aminoethylphosphonate-pyruvate transaminase